MKKPLIYLTLSVLSLFVSTAFSLPPFHNKSLQVNYSAIPNSSNRRQPLIPMHFRPYVGVNYLHINESYKNVTVTGVPVFGDGEVVLPDDFDGGSLHAGIEINHCLAIEAGYFQTKKESRQATVDSTPFRAAFKVKGWTVDGLGIMPITKTPGLQLITDLGWMYAKAASETLVNLDGLDLPSSGASDHLFFLGIGAQYSFLSHANARILVKYSPSSWEHIGAHTVSASFGINFLFS